MKFVNAKIYLEQLINDIQHSPALCHIFCWFTVKGTCPKAWHDMLCGLLEIVNIIVRYDCRPKPGLKGRADALCQYMLNIIITFSNVSPGFPPLLDNWESALPANKRRSRQTVYMIGNGQLSSFWDESSFTKNWTKAACANEKRNKALATGVRQVVLLWR